MESKQIFTASVCISDLRFFSCFKPCDRIRTSVQDWTSFCSVKLNSGLGLWRWERKCSSSLSQRCGSVYFGKKRYKHLLKWIRHGKTR